MNNITKFDSGAIRDSQDGKPDFVETISFTAHRRYAEYMTGKKKKYGQGNFKKGIPIDSYEKSLLRHIDKYFRNKYENGNDEPNEDHIAAMRFNIDGIMHEEERAKKVLYISGKITNKNPVIQAKNIAKFTEKEKELTKLGFKVHNPAKVMHKGWKWGQYMEKDITFLIKHRPQMYMFLGWEESDGARFEHSVAKELGLSIIYE